MAAELWTPPGADLGYNMGGPQTPPGQPGPAQPGGFWNRMKAGAGAYGVARRQQFSFGDTTSPEMKAGLGAYDPTGRAEATWGATKWAFRGQRTTPNPQSEAQEQNIYGGVARDVIPTRRISTQPLGSPGGGEGLTRERLNKEAYESTVYPMMQRPGVPESASQNPPPPMQRMEMPMMPSPMSADPLFARNTGQVPYNQNQFGSVHQRATAGT